MLEFIFPEAIGFLLIAIVMFAIAWLWPTPTDRD
jgi:hypothetical protein